KRSLDDYLAIAASDERIEKGRANAQRHAKRRDGLLASARSCPGSFGKDTAAPCSGKAQTRPRQKNDTTIRKLCSPIFCAQ
ncbi:MAG: hypothetical protein AAFR45_03950, partial [Pseudomonadota bacterium]